MSTTPNPPPAADPIKPWFEALESMDEFIGIRFGQVNQDTNTVDWKFLPHTDFDGIGAFAHLLREGGAEVNDLPKITHPAPLSWWAFLRTLPQMLGPRRRLELKPIDRGTKVEKANQPAPAVSWHVFNEEETAKIRRIARSAQVTVNSFLIKYLDRAVRPYLTDPSQAIPWMVPVNLRGKVSQPRDTENHSSYVAIRIYASEGVKEVHRHIYETLQKGHHCANWKAFSASRFTSPSLKRHLINSDRAVSQWSLGGFSNIGAWDPEKKITQEKSKGPWLFCPPVLRTQLIGAGCVTFQGKLSLTLQLHPDLTTSPEVAQRWMQNWVNEIALGLPGATPIETSPTYQ